MNDAYVIRYAGQYEGALAACRCPIKTTRYASVEAAERDIAMIATTPHGEMVSVPGEDGWYVYASEDDADADDDGSSAMAVITRAPKIEAEEA